METWWLLPISAVCNRDQTYSVLLLGAELGSRVATGISQESESPMWGQWVGEGSTWWDFFSLPSFPSVTLLSPFSRVEAGQWGERCSHQQNSLTWTLVGGCCLSWPTWCSKPALLWNVAMSSSERVPHQSLGTLTCNSRPFQDSSDGRPDLGTGRWVRGRVLP